jgi:hypothetical protein
MTSARSFERITRADLQRLARVAALDREDLFQRRPETGRLYAGQVFAVALCQGAALHFVHGQRGVKDFDVWSFYRASAQRPYPFRRRGVRDFGDPKFGITADHPQFVGRRVDLLGRSLEAARVADPAQVLQDYFRGGRTRSARLLALRPVVLLEPASRLGEVIWPGADAESA